MNRLLPMALLATLAAPTTLTADLPAQSVVVEGAKKATKTKAAQDPHLQAIRELRKEVQELRKLVEKLAAQKNAAERPTMVARSMPDRAGKQPAATRVVFERYFDADQDAAGRLQTELKGEGGEALFQVVEAQPAPQDPGTKKRGKHVKVDADRPKVMILRSDDGEGIEIGSIDVEVELDEGGAKADQITRKLKQILGQKRGKFDAKEVEVRIESEDEDMPIEAEEALRAALEMIGESVLQLDGGEIDIRIEHDEHDTGEHADPEDGIRRMIERRLRAGGIRGQVERTEHEPHGHEDAEGMAEKVLRLIERELGGNDEARRIHVEILDEGDMPAGGRKFVELNGDRDVLFWKQAPQRAPNQGCGCDACGCDGCKPKPNAAPAHPHLPNKKRGKDAPRPAIRRVLRMGGTGGPPQRMLRRVFRTDAGGDGPRRYAVLLEEPEGETAPGKQRVRVRALPGQPGKPTPGQQPLRPVPPPPMAPKIPVEEKLPKARRVRVIRD